MVMPTIQDLKLEETPALLEREGPLTAAEEQRLQGFYSQIQYRYMATSCEPRNVLVVLGLLIVAALLVWDSESDFQQSLSMVLGMLGWGSFWVWQKLVRYPKEYKALWFELQKALDTCSQVQVEADPRWPALGRRVLDLCLTLESRKLLGSSDIFGRHHYE